MRDRLNATWGPGRAEQSVEVAREIAGEQLRVQAPALPPPLRPSAADLMRQLSEPAAASGASHHCT